MLLDTATSVNVKQSREIKRFLHHVLGTPDVHRLLIIARCMQSPDLRWKVIWCRIKTGPAIETHTHARARVIFRVVTSTAADAQLHLPLAVHED